MGYPILIAQTPRAGRFNHINLLPSIDVPFGFSSGDYLGAAAGRAVGENYLAVSKTVNQVDSVREGQEILVLAGVRLPADEQFRSELLKWLVDTLDAVGHLVVTRDWTNHDGGSLCLEELAEYQKECVARFRLTAYRGECSRPLTRRPRKERRGWLVSTAILVMVGLWAGYYMALRQTPSDPHDPMRVEPGIALADPEQQAVKHAWEHYDRLVTPSGGDQRVRMLVALDGLDDFSKPSNFAAMTEADQKEWLTRCRPFRSWLVHEFGPAGHGSGQTTFSPYLGKLDPEAVATIERVTGSLRSPEEMFRGRTRMRALHRLLVRLREIEVKSTIEDPERFHLFYWTSEFRRNEQPLPAEPATDLPFLTPREARMWMELLRHVESLDAAIRRVDSHFDRDKASLFALTSSKRLRDITQYFQRGSVGSKYDFYSGGGARDGGPLTVALQMVSLLQQFATDIGETDNPVPE